MNEIILDVAAAAGLNIADMFSVSQNPYQNLDPSVPDD